MDLISKLMFDQCWRDIKLPRRCLQSASRRWCGWIIHVDQRHCSSDSTLTPTLIMCSSSDRSQFSPWESTGVEASQFQENFPRVTYRTGSNYVMLGLFLQPNLLCESADQSVFLDFAVSLKNTWSVSVSKSVRVRSHYVMLGLFLQPNLLCESADPSVFCLSLSDSSMNEDHTGPDGWSLPIKSREMKWGSFL